MSFDFSDHVSVFLNGRLLFSGTNTWESRYPFYLGTIFPDNLAVTLMLNIQEGENRLTMLVSERFFGWGFAAKMVRPNGVSVR